MPSVKMKIELLNFTMASEFIIERAGRVCTDTESKGDYESATRFIRARIKEGHFSILEHASATFLISGISRACSHQLVRHRHAQYLRT